MNFVKGKTAVLTNLNTNEQTVVTINQVKGNIVKVKGMKEKFVINGNTNVANVDGYRLRINGAGLIGLTHYPRVNIDADDFDFLIGKKITKVAYDSTNGMSGYVLETSDGTRFKVYENEGCGGCSLGWSELPDLRILETVENAITNVISETYQNSSEFKLFILYEDTKFTLEGDVANDNGYYGSGFYLTVEYF